MIAEPSAPDTLSSPNSQILADVSPIAEASSTIAPVEMKYPDSALCFDGHGVATSTPAAGTAKASVSK